MIGASIGADHGLAGWARCAADADVTEPRPPGVLPSAETRASRPRWARNRRIPPATAPAGGGAVTVPPVPPPAPLFVLPLALTPFPARAKA